MTLQVDDAVRRQLDRFDELTSGDFANAARRIGDLELPASAWLDEIEAEHRAKAGAKR